MIEVLEAAAGVLVFSVYVLGSVVLVSVGVWRSRPPRSERRRRRFARLSAMQPPRGCPFCGRQMRPGRIYTRTGSPTIWQDVDARPPRRFWSVYSYVIPQGEKLVLGVAHRGTRGASTCDSCDAVLIDPRPSEAA